MSSAPSAAKVPARVRRAWILHVEDLSHKVPVRAYSSDDVHSNSEGMLVRHRLPKTHRYLRIRRNVQWFNAVQTAVKQVRQRREADVEAVGREAGFTPVYMLGRKFALSAEDTERVLAGKPAPRPPLSDIDFARHYQ